MKIWGSSLMAGLVVSCMGIMMAGLVVSCMGIKASKHTYVAATQGVELGGAEVRLGFRAEGSKPGSVMLSAMVVSGGVAEFDGPFSWRVEALGEVGRHQRLIIYRIRTRTLKSGREEWYPAEHLGRYVTFEPVKDLPGRVRARFPIPGLLRVRPEEDGGLEVWLDAAVVGPAGPTRRLMKFRLDATEKDASEWVFLPTEIVRSLTTDEEDWDDPMWD